MKRQKAYVALLRGINVGGNKPIPMKPLTALCAGIGWTGIRTCLQTGNVVFRSAGSAQELEVQLERAILDHFGFPVSVVVRDAVVFGSYIAEVPFVSQTATEPSRVLLYLTKLPPRPDTAETLTSRSLAGEIVVLAGDALWIFFPNGIGPSKLTPALIDRAVGSIATGRNWTTVTRIQQLLCS
ncbi:MAG: DUF1697 domain-containing protein [Verrucomicrobiales bacterium]